eukprot:scaffold2849_cov121-Isochrysis_galbana.AAC.2
MTYDVITICSDGRSEDQLSKTPHAPERGVGRPPRNEWSASLGTRGVGSFSFPRPLVPSLPRRHVLGKCACFCAEGIGSPSPAKEGGLSCGGANNDEHM